VARVHDPLAGIRVLDLTNALAGTSATQILASLGAEVIKVEKPDGGEYTRSLMPYIFQANNRGKRSFAIDLKHPEGSALVRRLAASCDVFVQSMRPGAAREVGLSPEELAEVNPRLIYVSFSAFGAQGPSAHRRGVDGVLQAESGLAMLQNGVLGNTSFVDSAAGLSLSQAVLIAVMKRERFGVVEPVDVSLLDTAIYMQSAPITEFSTSGGLLDQRSYVTRYPIVGVYGASDGPFYVAPYYERDWLAVASLLEREDLVSDPRFADQASRVSNAVALRSLLQAELGQRARADWVSGLEKRGVLAGFVRRYDEVLSDPQIAANQSLEHHELADGSTAVFPRSPFRFRGQPLTTSHAAPALGADTAALLDELHVDDATRAELERLGVIRVANTERQR
jgi:crotonobetainyl-CoA:carnitine CoA-transferase CaiB-like acyl-CoA transferase